MRLRITCFAVVLLGLCVALSAKAEVRGSPDVLVLGDSQLSFGAGKAFVEVLDQIKESLINAFGCAELAA